MGTLFLAHRVQGHFPKTTEVCHTCSGPAPLEGFNRPVWVPGHIPEPIGDPPLALKQAASGGHDKS